MRVPTLEQRLKVREIPNRKHIHLQSWHELLFLHWNYDPEKLQTFLPKGLYIDTYEGKGYVGIVPFFMKDIKPVFFGKIPGLNFYEMNVRTYVFDDQGNPGVWFFSLDASNWLATMMGKFFFHLPYFYSSFKVNQNKEGWIYYQCKRTNKSTASYSYKRGSLRGTALPGTLEFFLIERYLLFAKNSKGTLFKGIVHHTPYELYDSELTVWDEQPLVWNDLAPLNAPPDHQIIAAGVNVNIYPLENVFALES